MMWHLMCKEKWHYHDHVNNTFSITLRFSSDTLQNTVMRNFSYTKKTVNVHNVTLNAEYEEMAPS